MNELCGCCEGVEQITPVSNVNRPGLGALHYRVGTHAAFLETMIARLSGFSFAAQPGPLSPLRALTTRETSDATMAFLDAWATVADVLTFYQERIANEGFLRTATERRSVIELARLLGYAPRPGVSASVYLAYTLEDGSEVTIAAGTRAQSVPGPDELPQTFETAEDLYARAEWNTLQPRLTRPQFSGEGFLVAARPLYLKGTATNLKVNDPLLIDFDGLINQRLFRVLKVEPDQANDRTRVTLESWDHQFVAPVIPMPVTQPPFVIVVRGIIERHKRTEDFEVNAETRTAERILGVLNELESKLTAQLTSDSLRRLIEEHLPQLREEHRVAREGNFTKLAPWIGSIISQLEAVVESILSAQTTTHSATTLPAQSSLVQLSGLLGALNKPPTRNPSSRQQLGRSITGTFAAASDALPKLLTAFKPALRNQLYQAWQNLPVTPSVAARVYALRTRASVFGHNAPQRPVLIEGNIDHYEEWTLFRDQGGGGATEHFSIETTTQATRIIVSVALESPKGSSPATGSANRALQNGTFKIALPGIGEEVSVNVSNVTPAQLAFQATLKFTFKVRGLTVSVDLSSGGDEARMIVDSTGSNPTKVTHTTLTLTSAGAERENLIVVEGDLSSAGGGIHPTETANAVSLDASYPEILPGSWVVLERATPLAPEGQPPLLIRRAVRVSEGSRADYGTTAKGTQLQLNGAWIAPESDQFNVIRTTTVLAESELLELAEEPLDPVREAVCGNRIELASLAGGLEPGRWLIITGERTDIVSEQADIGSQSFPPAHFEHASAVAGNGDGSAKGSTQDTAMPTAEMEASATGEVNPHAKSAVHAEALESVIPGVRASELVMLAGVEQGYDKDLHGDRTHTTLLLAKELAYCYKLDTVSIYGNVVRATHGETQAEILGSGDASQAMQSFKLRQSPLTYLSAPTPSGLESTLKVRVNNILWHETESLAGLSQQDRSYTTRTDDEDQTTLVFGNGREGARPSTGMENITARYRTGTGHEGNARADQISVAVDKPLGVTEVINPLRASGGADREDRDQVRRNAPLAVMSIDRLIATVDYEDFARTFAGIGKASAARLSDGRREVVHLTIAGTDDIPVAEDSDLYKNLRAALHRYGDPFQPLKIAHRFLRLLVISARVRLHPDYIWESVEPKVREALLDRFSFQRRELGQMVVLSEVISTIQGVGGVLYVDVDTLDSVAEDITASELLQLSADLKLNQCIRVFLAQVDRSDLDPSTRIRPAQLALLNRLVPETLILTELK
jgi:hypothetical protein